MIFCFSIIAVISWIKRADAFSVEQCLLSCMLLLFLFVGLVFLSTPIWFLTRAKKTVYLLTNKRAVIWIPEIFRGVKVWQIRRRDLGHVHRTEYGDGTGDVVLQEFFAQYSEKWGKSETEWNRIGFLAIPDVKTVEALVRKTLMTVSDSTGPND